MKLLLIFPPQNHPAIANLHAEVNESAGRYPPLGLLYVASAVERSGRHEAEVVDAVLENLDGPAIAQRVRSVRPDAVGFYATTYYLQDVIDTVRAVTEAAPGIPIVMGGPHARIFPRQAAGIAGVSAVVCGEGEEVIIEILDRWALGSGVDDISGVVTPANHAGPIVSRTIADIDGLAVPARHLTLHKRYWSLLSRANPITTMMSSRGCPFHCHFCNNIESAQRVRMHSPGRVVDEMEAVVRMGIRNILFFDEIFTFSTPRIMEICAEIRRRGLEGIAWHVRSRCDTIDPAAVQAMASAGCRMIQFGIETGTARMQKMLNKNLDLGRVKAVVKACRDAGILTYGDFILGNPQETREEMMRTVDFAIDLRLDYAIFGILQPLFGTEIYARGMREGRITRDYWLDFVKDPSRPIATPYWPGDFEPAELDRINAEAYRRFYLRPSYMWQRFRAIDSWWQAAGHARAAARFFLGSSR